MFLQIYNPPAFPRTPWYKENPFWGGLGAFLAFYLTAVGVIGGDPILAGCLFLAAWPCGVMAIWVAINGLTARKWLRITGRIVAIILVGALVGVTDLSMTKKNSPAPTAAAPSQRSQPETLPTIEKPQPPTAAPPKIQPSFVLLSPGPLLNQDSWDFIVAHKGKEKIESIDVMFIDEDKLEHIQRTTAPGVAVMPNEYSVLVHIDQMYPKGRGSLFAKQFIWKPFSLEHGHYRVDISASTGRFHEEIYIEKVNEKWQYAAKLDDIDTHETRFVCRDPAFPSSVAPKIVAKRKCWPDIVQDE
jgi:hypothetical protein